MRPQEEMFIFDVMLQALSTYHHQITTLSKLTSEKLVERDLKAIAKDMESLIDASEAERRNSIRGKNKNSQSSGN